MAGLVLWDFTYSTERTTRHVPNRCLPLLFTRTCDATSIAAIRLRSKPANTTPHLSSLRVCLFLHTSQRSNKKIKLQAADNVAKMNQITRHDAAITYTCVHNQPTIELWCKLGVSLALTGQFLLRLLFPPLGHLHAKNTASHWKVEAEKSC